MTVGINILMCYSLRAVVHKVVHGWMGEGRGFCHPMEHSANLEALLAVTVGVCYCRLEAQDTASHDKQLFNPQMSVVLKLKNPALR